MNKVKITNVCDIQVGKTPSRSNNLYWGSGSLWLSIADMKQGRFLEKTKETITEKAIKECNCKLIPSNTVLFSFKLSIGKVGITKVPMYTNEAIAAFIIKDQSQLDTKFLYYVLKSVDHSIGSNKAVMGKTLNKELLKKIEIPLLPIKEQKQIVKILDYADSLRQKRNQSLSLLENYIKSIFLEMFGDPIINPKGWNTESLAKVAKLERGRFSPRPRNDPSYFGGKYPFIQTGDISNSNYRLNTYTQTLNDKGTRVSKEFFKEDIVIAIVGATIGVTAILKIDVYATDSVICIKPNETIVNNIYLEYVLRFWREPLLKSAPEFARPNINLAILNKLKIILPPIQHQRNFANIMLKIEQLKRKMLNQENELETQFQSLMQKSFL